MSLDDNLAPKAVLVKMVAAAISPTDSGMVCGAILFVYTVVLLPAHRVCVCVCARGTDPWLWC